MKRYLCIVLFFLTVINATAASLEINKMYKNGDWLLTTVPEGFQGSFSVGLSFKHDTDSDSRFYLRVQAKYIDLSSDRQLVIKFDDGSTLETKVSFNLLGYQDKKFLGDKVGIIEVCDAYYILSNEQLQNLLTKKVVKCHIDTEGKIYKMKDDDNRFGRVIKVAYECIQNRIKEENEKDIYKDL